MLALTPHIPMYRHKLLNFLLGTIWMVPTLCGLKDTQKQCENSPSLYILLGYSPNISGLDSDDLDTFLSVAPSSKEMKQQLQEDKIYTCVWECSCAPHIHRLINTSGLHFCLSSVFSPEFFIVFLLTVCLFTGLRSFRHLTWSSL